MRIVSLEARDILKIGEPPGISVKHVILTISDRKGVTTIDYSADQLRNDRKEMIARLARVHHTTERSIRQRLESGEVFRVRQTKPKWKF